MRNVLLRTQLLSLALIFASVAYAQTLFGNADYVSPGHNSCKAVEVISYDYNLTPDFYGGIDFPVPTGLTIGQLSTISTDYMATSGGIGLGSPRIVVETSSGYLFFYIGDYPNYTSPDNLNTWYNSGNLAEPTDFVDAQNYGGGPYEPYGAFQTAHSNDVITAIYIVQDAGYAFNGNQTIQFDNTKINSTTYNYDDVDDDGIIDCFVCDQQAKKIFICHNGQTLCVSKEAWEKGHSKHPNDQLGPCAAPVAHRSVDPTESVLAPEKFTLSSSPNPFKGVAKLEYSVPVDSKVTIKVYDLLGREVSTLVNANRKAGIYNESIDGSKLSTGVYYARMIATAGSKQIIQTQKLIRAE